MGMTNYLEAAILDHIFNGVPYTAPTDIYLSLYTAAMTDVGTDGTEMVGGSYARQVVTSSMATSPDGRVSSNAVVTFTNLPAGTIVAAGLHDAATGGNMLYYTTLTSPRTVVGGDSLTVAIGDLNVYQN